MTNQGSIFLNRYLSNEKNNFADNSCVEPAIFLMEKLSFSMKLFSGHFYGHSFIKTVRGPLGIQRNRVDPDQTAPLGAV